MTSPRDEKAGDPMCANCGTDVDSTASENLSLIGIGAIAAAANIAGRLAGAKPEGIEYRPLTDEEAAHLATQLRNAPRMFRLICAFCAETIEDYEACKFSNSLDIPVQLMAMHEFLTDLGIDASKCNPNPNSTDPVVRS